MERLDLTRLQVEAIAAHLRDQLDDDERAYLDTLEGETDLFEWVRRLLGKIEEDEGNVAALKEQIGDRNTRKGRAEQRIETTREALKALLDCARLDKLALPEATLSIRDVAPKAVVTDEAAVPDEYCRIVRKPDMAAIKAGLDTGPIDGVSLDNGGVSLTIRRK
ncbi:MAG: siphovirus Gp157 family protein [Pseudomonadota bacterium]